MKRDRMASSDLCLCLPPAIWEKCLELQVALTTEKVAVMRNKYRLGLLGQEVVEYQKRAFSTGLMPKVCKFLDLNSQRVMDRAIRLVNLFSEKEVNNLIKPSKDGYTIGWGHFDYVMLNYLSKEQMVKYLIYARDNAVSCCNMYEKIKKEHGRASDPQGRKTIKTAAQFVKVTTNYLDKCVEQDSYINAIPSSELTSWITKMDSAMKQQLVHQLEKHMEACVSFSRKLKLA